MLFVARVLCEARVLFGARVLYGSTFFYMDTTKPEDAIDPATPLVDLIQSMGDVGAIAAGVRVPTSVVGDPRQPGTVENDLFEELEANDRRARLAEKFVRYKGMVMIKGSETSITKAVRNVLRHRASRDASLIRVPGGCKFPHVANR